jgi:hypothetical protein
VVQGEHAAAGSTLVRFRVGEEYTHLAGGLRCWVDMQRLRGQRGTAEYTLAEIHLDWLPRRLGVPLHLLPG